MRSLIRSWAEKVTRIRIGRATRQARRAEFSSRFAITSRRKLSSNQKPTARKVVLKARKEVNPPGADEYAQIN
jgi:hypothetical protein